MSDIFNNDSLDQNHNKIIKRIDGNYILEEIQSVFSFERGFLFTVKELTVNPGTAVKEFLNEDRKRLIKPILFLIFTSLIYSILNNILSFEDGYVKYSGENDSTIFTLFEWVQQNYGYSNILLAIFIGFWTRLFFIKYGYNIFEIFVLLCFIMGYGMLIFSVFAIIQSIVNQDVMQIAGVAGFIYTFWAIGQFYDRKKLINYIKAFLAYILGMMTFGLAILSIGLAIDLLN
ncbi:DUF3667 domain-containing protein [Salegentibacter sp. LM13S]|uniref:DUF3667 domain-containing protein n=1 Tax=Salegentibacter lacus TaxID=2873599 RepID=UPI001CCE7937|nr:DUF3667 domain-containing protein [Salegentibacter lacus]MBZ9632666.1 DUF3667 domain-containing protein [Salegentibacter lacus]